MASISAPKNQDNNTRQIRRAIPLAEYEAFCDEA
jgi:hypothetical protein